MKQRTLVSAFIVFLCACLLISAALLAGPSKKERQEIQEMINRGNKLRETYEKERDEFIRLSKKMQFQVGLKEARGQEKLADKILEEHKMLRHRMAQWEQKVKTLNEEYDRYLEAMEVEEK